jgi:3-hydroxyacyl-[acyl-carrier-protein] dehydratase
MNAEEVNLLVRAGRKRRLFEPTALQAVSLDRAEIERLLHHREPLLLIDRVTAVDRLGLAAAGTRRINPADPLLLGHFPNNPIYPGVLQLEIIGQLGLCLLGLLEDGTASDAPEGRPRLVRILKIHHAVFLAEVKPGDDLAVLVKIIEADEYTAVCAGQIANGEMICAFAVMEVYFVDA